MSARQAYDHADADGVRATGETGFWFALQSENVCELIMYSLTHAVCGRGCKASARRDNTDNNPMLQRGASRMSRDAETAHRDEQYSHPFHLLFDPYFPWRHCATVHSLSRGTNMLLQSYSAPGAAKYRPYRRHSLEEMWRTSYQAGMYLSLSLSLIRSRLRWFPRVPYDTYLYVVWIFFTDQPGAGAEHGVHRRWSCARARLESDGDEAHPGGAGTVQQHSRPAALVRVRVRFYHVRVGNQRCLLWIL